MSIKNANSNQQRDNRSIRWQLNVFMITDAQVPRLQTLLLTWTTGPPPSLASRRWRPPWRPPGNSRSFTNTTPLRGHLNTNNNTSKMQPIKFQTCQTSQLAKTIWVSLHHNLKLIQTILFPVFIVRLLLLKNQYRREHPFWPIGR